MKPDYIYFKNAGDFKREERRHLMERALRNYKKILTHLHMLEIYEVWKREWPPSVKAAGITN